MTLKYALYDWGGANIWLFHAINNIHGEWVDRIMLTGSSLGAHQRFPIYLALASLIAVIGASRYSLSRQALEQARGWLLVIAVFALAYTVEIGLIGWLKALADYPRPIAVFPPEAIQVIGHAARDHSLPSGHAAFAATLIASLWPQLTRPLRTFGVLFIVWVGLSRINLGQHFPADVLAGIFVGLGVTITLRYGLKILIGNTAETR